MKNHHIAFLVGIITIALSGLLLLQYNWIMDSLAIKEARFDQTVNEVLDKVATDVEKQEIAQMILSNVNRLRQEDGKQTVTREERHYTSAGNGQEMVLSQHIKQVVTSRSNVQTASTDSANTNAYSLTFLQKQHDILGFEAIPHFTDDHDYAPNGLLIQTILPGSNAQYAGLQAGDVVLTINTENQDCTSPIGTQNKNFEPGDVIQIYFQRKGEKHLSTTLLTSSGKEVASEASKKAPILGVYVEETPNKKGLLVTKVLNQCAADDAGLQQQDIILSLNTYNTTKVTDLRHVLGEYKIGDRVKITYARKDGIHSSTTHLTNRDCEDVQANYHIQKAELLGELYKGNQVQKAFLGIKVAESDNEGTGVLITEVVEGSPADVSGLQLGDIITAINQDPITSDAYLQEKLKLYNSGEEINISYKRKGDQQKATEIAAAAQSIAMANGSQAVVQTNESKSIDKVALAKLAHHEQLIQEFAHELTFMTKTLQERIDPEIFDDILTKNFHNAGIHIPFAYCLRSDAGEVVCASEEKCPQLPSKSLYKKNLFENTFNTNPGELAVHFPTQEKYILSSSWMTVGSSFLFNLIIILTFAYTIRTIIHQKKLSEMKTDFINNMTHELKTPISTISLACQMLTDKQLPKTNERVDRYAGIIKDENVRLQNHVDKVLQFARLEKSNLKMSKEALDMHDLIQDAIIKSALQVEQKKGSISYDLKASQATVDGDKLHLANVIFNILDNAIKYAKTEVPPKIHVTTYNTDAGLNITIKDNGIGMNRDTVKRVFDKFYRVPMGNLHNVKGFGLGLSYAKLMVEAHGGEISVKSKFNKGSIFEFTLPLAVS